MFWCRSFLRNGPEWFAELHKFHGVTNLGRGCWSWVCQQSLNKILWFGHKLLFSQFHRFLIHTQLSLVTCLIENMRKLQHNFLQQCLSVVHCLADLTLLSLTFEPHKVKMLGSLLGRWLCRTLKCCLESCNTFMQSIQRFSRWKLCSGLSQPRWWKLLQDA